MAAGKSEVDELLSQLSRRIRDAENPRELTVDIDANLKSTVEMRHSIRDHIQSLIDQIRRTEASLVDKLTVREENLRQAKADLDGGDYLRELKELHQRAFELKKKGVEELPDSLVSLPDDQFASTQYRFYPQVSLAVGDIFRICEVWREKTGRNRDVTFTNDGRVAVLCFHDEKQRVLLFDERGEVVADSGGNATDFYRANKMTYHQGEEAILVTDCADDGESGKVIFLDADNLRIVKELRLENAPLPKDIAVMSNGNIVTTHASERQRKVSIHTATGTLLKEITSYRRDACRIDPIAVGVDHHDNIVVCSQDAHANVKCHLLLFSPEGVGLRAIRDIDDHYARSVAVTRRGHVLTADGMLYGGSDVFYYRFDGYAPTGKSRHCGTLFNVPQRDRKKHGKAVAVATGGDGAVIVAYEKQLVFYRIDALAANTGPDCQCDSTLDYSNYLQMKLDL